MTYFYIVLVVSNSEYASSVTATKKLPTYVVRNHLLVSLLKSIFVNAKILILSYKISIFAFTKIVLEVLERRYSEMIVPQIPIISPDLF